MSDSSSEKCASLDGDGDRVVYYKRLNSKGLNLITMDKLYAFLMTYIDEKL